MRPPANPAANCTSHRKGTELVIERSLGASVETRRPAHGKSERGIAAYDPPQQRFLDRELSHLAFNERVLALTGRAMVPLAERLRYVCIVSSNLDEFFEIRASELMGEMRETGGLNAASPLWESFVQIGERAHALVDRQYEIYNEQIIPALARAHIVVLSHSKRTPAQRAWVKEYFEREVRPLLSPIGLDPAHPFPQVMNKTLNFIVQLDGKDAFGRRSTIAILKVPRALPRVIPLPSRLTPGRQAFVLLSSVIRAHLADLFARRGLSGFSQFRVTRDSELWVDEREVSDLRQALQVEMALGQGLRLLIDDGFRSGTTAPLTLTFTPGNWNTTQTVTVTAVVRARITVAAAAIVGSVSRVTDEYIRTGSVCRYGLWMKSDRMTSSKLVANAHNAPERTPGATNGSVTVRNVVQRRAPQMAAASSSRRSKPCRLASTGTMTNGRASTLCATTKPSVVPSRFSRR